MKIREGYALRKVADTGVVVGLDEMDCNHLMTLNQSGIEMWTLLEKSATVDELVEDLTSRYEVEESVARKDVEFFLAKLGEAGLLDE